MKRIRSVLIVLVVIIIGVVLLKNMIASAAFSGGVKAITGLNTQVKGVQVGLFNTTVGIKGLRVLNPSEFPDRVMVDVPEIFVDYDLGSFLKGNAHLETLRLHLSELHVIKSADGKVNLQSIKALESAKATESTKPPQPGRAPEFQIDVLELKIGKVVYKDYTVSPPAVKEFAVNIDQRYEHITNPYTFAGLIVTQALMRTTVGQLANFDVAGLQSNVTDALRLSAGQLKSTLTHGSEAVEHLGKDALGTAAGAVKDTTGALKKLLGN